MVKRRPVGRGPAVKHSEARPANGPVASPSGLVVVLLVAFAVLVVLSIAWWLLGLACGGS